WHRLAGKRLPITTTQPSWCSALPQCIRPYGAIRPLWRPKPLSSRLKMEQSELFAVPKPAVLYVAGIDEAGRGPLAGPVFAAAVILNPKRPIRGLADSKVLSAPRREDLANQIRERALAWSVASATVQEIDEFNILQATMLAMRRACLGLALMPDKALVDGNRV